MNRRQKAVAWVAALIAGIAIFLRPSNVHWNSLDSPPELLWGPYLLHWSAPQPDAWIFRTRYDILVGELVVLAILTWVLMSKLKTRAE